MKFLRKIPAWTFVAINLAAFPGLGTILAGRRVGYAQAVIMVTGFTMTMGYLVFYLGCVAAYMQGTPSTEAEFKARYQPHLWALRWGLACCAVAWCWSLFSSWQIWRSSRVPRSG